MTPRPPPAKWLIIVEGLIEQWDWGHTITLLAIVFIFSVVLKLSHARIDISRYRQKRAADAKAGIELQDAKPTRPPSARGHPLLSSPAGFTGLASNTRAMAKARAAADAADAV
ncbi:AMP-dependent synthetase/ligase [Penicillium verrucosum]|uniref:AMP-dependent synthetase/ligase n=1 Tax=Penicillium verrucosum TaxID=60171 RepID=UPI002544EF12|nr:AMP-dependent synthetase/ligase [Penicillium verrucosum]KAJ5944336.1 AMP-dependent synthetase/ligase [Penicillium verrucosum]